MQEEKEFCVLGINTDAAELGWGGAVGLIKGAGDPGESEARGVECRGKEGVDNLAGATSISDDAGE